MNKNIFEPRETLFPEEYPHLLKYADSIDNAFWVVDEYKSILSTDVQDFRTKLNEPKRIAVKRTMLAIAQIEVKVKMFWAKIYDKMPKPEIMAVGMTFASNEVRHMRAYRRLIEILGLQDDFATLLQVPEISGRVNYLSKYLDGTRSRDNRIYTKSLMLFALFVEHVSLFSQFLIMLTIHKEENILSGFSNIVDATMQEENVHGLFGSELVSIIRQENPDWFDEELEGIIHSACEKALKAESKLLDWIFENGELEYLSKEEIVEFLKNRFNLVLIGSGFKPVFEVDPLKLQSTDWLEVQLKASKEGDFFYKRITDYSKFNQSMTEDDLY